MVDGLEENNTFVTSQSGRIQPGRQVAEKGRRFSNFVEMIYFAEQEVKLFLKARSRIIQMTDSRDGILKMAEYRVIYEYPKDNPPASAS